MVEQGNHLFSNLLFNCLVLLGNALLDLGGTSNFQCRELQTVPGVCTLKKLQNALEHPRP